MAADLDVTRLWPHAVGLSEVQRGPVRRTLVADEAARARIARALGLDSLESLEAELRASPWLDGVLVEGRWRARVGQTCGVSLEPFQSDLQGEIRVRALPQGSAGLGGADEGGREMDIDPEAEDPPDVLEGNELDLGAYVVEDLSLAIDPFPRKPGVEFQAPEPAGEPSPFAVLAKLKGGAPDA